MSTETTSASWAVCFIPSERALAFTARDTFSPPTYFVARTALGKAVSVKPLSLCQAVLLQELLLMATGFVAEFSFCVPGLQRTTTYMDSYFTVLFTIVVKTETDRLRIY